MDPFFAACVAAGLNTVRLRDGVMVVLFDTQEPGRDEEVMLLKATHIPDADLDVDYVAAPLPFFRLYFRELGPRKRLGLE
jgi:hypothetical protein